MQNLQDAEDEMLIALDTDEKVPFMVGEVFIMKTQVNNYMVFFLTKSS